MFPRSNPPAHLNASLPWSTAPETEDCGAENAGQLPCGSPAAALGDSSQVGGPPRRRESTLAKFSRLFRHQEAASGSVNECADIDHPQWDELQPALRKYVKARMQKALAQQRHFGADHLESQKGICRGMGSVWLRLHQAKPSAKASVRMSLLMSERGTAHATIAQRLYAQENVHHHSGAAPSLKRLLELGLEAQFDTAVSNLSSVYSSQARCISNEFFTGSAAYLRAEQLLKRSPGYYDLGISLTNQSGEEAGHNLSVFSQGDRHSLTVFDSNLGECKVPPGELPRFMNEMSRFYQATRAYAFSGIRSILKMEFTEDVSATPLAQLAGELD